MGETKLSKITQEDKYQIYINEHIENVMRAWYNMKNIQPLKLIIIKIWDQNLSSMDLESVYNTTESNIQVHDASKRGPNKFDAYRKNFYPVDEKEKEDNLQYFEKSWQHHYSNNMHHWDWWAESGNKENMPLSFVLEMCCDWIAMSMYYGTSDAIDWYKKNRRKIKLGKKQKALVESILQLYYTYYDVKGTRIKD